MLPPNLITGKTARLPGVPGDLHEFPATPRPKKSRMNKTEAAFASELHNMIGRGEIVSWKFEAVKLRLADTCFYTPDFFVVERDGSMTFYEVKGFWRDDARVKFKVAAETFPCFRFVAVTRKGGQWHFEEK